MNIGKASIFRLTAGLVAVLAIALVVVGLGFTSGGTSAQEGETATVNDCITAPREPGIDAKYSAGS